MLPPAMPLAIRSKPPPIAQLATGAAPSVVTLLEPQLVVRDLGLMYVKNP